MIMDKILAAKVYWLTKNTKLTDRQIAQHYGVHALEVFNIRNNHDTTIDFDLVELGYLTREQITASEENPDIPLPSYTPKQNKITRSKKRIVT